MIRQDIYLQRYDWHVRVYYAATTYWVERIVRDLRLIGCSGADLEEARRNLSAGRLDTGLTYSNVPPSSSTHWNTRRGTSADTYP